MSMCLNVFVPKCHYHNQATSATTSTDASTTTITTTTTTATTNDDENMHMMAIISIFGLKPEGLAPRPCCLKPEGQALQALLYQA